MINSICVYCSSRNVVDESFFRVSAAMGQAIAKQAGTLVYGGGSVGLMGEVARATQKHGGKVVGVIPESMVEHELAYEECDELIVTNTMRQRKQIMEDRADAFVTLPGGFGTMEELFEILTHRQLDYHTKPVVILNPDGFYDPLLELFEHFYEHRFAHDATRASYSVAEDVAGVFRCLGNEKMGE